MADDIRGEYGVNVGEDVPPQTGAPVVAETPVVAAPVTETASDEQREELREQRRDARDRRNRISIVSHSKLLYWWPVWAFGYVMAALTWFTGETVQIGNLPEELIIRSNGPGLVYTLVIFFVILITNVSLRGWISGMVVMTGLFLAVLLAWLGWWDEILQALPHVNVHMNFGFYMLLSTLVFLLWLATVFIFDRLTYWRVEAGQVTLQHLVGGGAKSYDTMGMTLEDRHDDLFRHWILGFGSGDMRMRVAGQTYELPNVVFAPRKVARIQELIKRKPS